MFKLLLLQQGAEKLCYNFLNQWGNPSHMRVMVFDLVNKSGCTNLQDLT
jgi:hypothetical protein